MLVIRLITTIKGEREIINNPLKSLVNHCLLRLFVYFLPYDNSLRVIHNPQTV